MFVLISKIGTSKKFKFSFDSTTKSNLRKYAKELAHMRSFYDLTITAETLEDMDYISDHFYNIPMPSHAKKAHWYGDMALFILSNLPDK